VINSQVPVVSAGGRGASNLTFARLMSGTGSKAGRDQIGGGDVETS